MLKPYSIVKAKGFTLVELIIVVTVIAIISAIAVPSFQTWLESSRIRNAAAATLNGMQKARGEAIARNRNVEFVITGTTSSWTVRLADGTVLDTRLDSEGSQGVVSTLTPAAARTVTFNSFGNVNAVNADGSAPLSRVAASIVGSRANSLAVDVNNGSVKMCNPKLAAGPRAC